MKENIKKIKTKKELQLFFLLKNFLIKIYNKIYTFINFINFYKFKSFLYANLGCKKSARQIDNQWINIAC